MLFWTLISSIAAALMGLGVFIFYLRKGQFEDSEEVKYQLFRDDNPDS